MLRIKTTRDRSKTSHLIAFLTTCIVLLLPMSAFPFPTWVYVDPDMPEGSPPEIEITNHCDDYTKVKVTIPGFWCEDVYEAGHTFQKIWVPMYGTKMEEGKPELPVVRGLLGIPGVNNATDVEVLSATWEQFSDYLVYPHQPDHPETEPPPPFEWDDEFYQQNTWYPGDEALLSNQGMLRDIKVVNSHIQCFQYNPARGFLKVADEMEIKVSYGASGGGSGGLQLEGETINRVHEDFMPMYQSLIWNCNELNLVKSEPIIDYLIITANNYYGALLPLKIFLEERGYETEIVCMYEIPNCHDPLQLYRYIELEYATYGFAHVLLVGDVQDDFGAQPFNENTMVPFPYWLPDYYSPYIKPCDSCYACLGNDDPPSRPPESYDDEEWNNWWYNSDWHPDLYVARLTADEVKHVQTQVDKIIYYETPLDPPPNPDHPWYDHMLFVAYQGDYFRYRKEEVQDPQKIYEPSYEIELPHVYFLWGGDGISTNDTVMDCIQNPDLGCFIVNYRGHGNWCRWGRQDDGWTITEDHWTFVRYLSSPHVLELTNDHLVVVFNIACDCGQIDHWEGKETICDYWMKYNRNLVDPIHGAVATIGATRVTWSNINNLFDRAIFRMMYGPYAVPEPIKGLTEPMNILGAVHFGAMNMVLCKEGDYSLSALKEVLRTAYDYILLGDPSMKIRNKFTEGKGLNTEKPNFLMEKQPLKVTIYPNPSPGIFTLKVQGYSPGVGEIKVYDLSGRLIRKIEFPEQETTMGGLDTGLREMEIPLDLSDMSEGLYLLNLGDEVTERVLILK